jgi:tRNA nucleotidyltransferase (CCA-adding enzyme)
MSTSSGQLRERVRRVPGMERLLPALEGLPPAYLVGGAVRDLIRAQTPTDVDIAIEGDARSAARAVADRLGGQAREFERFGTADVKMADGDTYNFATTREEVYDAPGALPRVKPASLAEDLRRRDFTVNTMAVGLTGDDLGHLYDPFDGQADLDRRLIRVLHDRSFLDDPTRLLRGVRYATRLDFALEPETERLAREAVAGEALSTVSGARIGADLMPLLSQEQVGKAVELLRDLEIHTALHPELDPDPELVASAALGAAAIGADRAVSALAALVESAPEELDLWLADLQLLAEERDAAARAARVAPRIATALRERDRSPSELRALLGREPLEALALALALRAPSEPVLRWATSLRGVSLEISGDDLLAAGVPEGPALGRALEETLRRKLDGIVSGRDEELETALLLAREPAQ